MKSIAYDLFKKHNVKISDLFGKEVKDMGYTTYKNYYALFTEVMKAYKPAPMVSIHGETSLGYAIPEELTEAEKKDLEEMIEAIIDIIYYAKHKGEKA